MLGKGGTRSIDAPSSVAASHINHERAARALPLLMQILGGKP